MSRSRPRIILISFLTYVSAQPARSTDADVEAVVDLDDFTRFLSCLQASGPEAPSGLLCFGERADFDSDVDLADFAIFQNHFTGPRGPVCGNGVVEFGEECDDGNLIPGDGCDAGCLIERIANDQCDDAIFVGDGGMPFSNVGATTDGPDEPQCNFFNRSQVESDIWFVYTATCDGTAVFSLCGSDYDTKLAVYEGTRCPPRNILACSDDDCGTVIENLQSRIEISVAAGQQYLIRVGSFEDFQGSGFLNIGCDVRPCESAAHPCFEAAPNGAAGCADSVCCESVCDFDAYCCDATWDAQCAEVSIGVCTGNFPACTEAAGACGVAHGSPGCDSTACCNNVCLSDLFCCLEEWDATCAYEARSICLLTCGAGAGACNVTHLTPGCSDESCCALVCGSDEFCCSTEWDQVCVDLAAQDCP